MSINSEIPVATDILMSHLERADAYPHQVEGEVEVHETHISIVFLAGEFAYKIKKPIKTDFLDYSTLDRRKHHYEEELRLGRRYANDLYLSVVPIGWVQDRLCVEAPSEPIEYALKMQRFPKGALLSERCDAGKLTTAEVVQLAETIASFHQDAALCEPEFAAEWPAYLVKDFHRIIRVLQSGNHIECVATLKRLSEWSREYFHEHLPVFEQRSREGFIRECHGDLHLQNVVRWKDKLIPFDGIEFNERLRWIDVLSDSAFLQMDFAVRGHTELARSFMNAYLERSGDYGSLVMLRGFLIYRSLIRALVATIRSEQPRLAVHEKKDAALDVCQHIELAWRFSVNEAPRLWITHGASGSGKTTLSEFVVQHHNAFRLRSDIERKRLFGLKPTERPSPEMQTTMYSEQANEKTYRRLEELAEKILRAGYSVIMDATFLMRSDRERARQLAIQEEVEFAIVHCQADEFTLRRRVTDRMKSNNDASDADLQVLERQLASMEPLTEAEQSYVYNTDTLSSNRS